MVSKSKKGALAGGIIMGAFALAMLVFMILSFLSDDPDVATLAVFCIVLFIICGMFAALFLLMYFNKKVIYGDETFTYVSITGKKQEYKYDEVSFNIITENKTDYYYQDKKIFSLFYNFTNFHELEKRVTEAKKAKKREI